MKMDQENVDRFLALLLIIGGAAGLVLAILLSRTSLPFLFSFVFVVMFGLSAWVGAGLWRGRPRYHVWAALIFALQVPIVTCSAFSYRFFTAMTLGLTFENAAENKLNFEWELGSKLSFSVPSNTPDLIFGVNLIAVAAMAYLLFVPRKSVKSSSQNQLVSPLEQTAE
jgi:hypothetical protein